MGTCVDSKLCTNNSTVETAQKEKKGEQKGKKEDTGYSTYAVKYEMQHSLMCFCRGSMG